MLVSHTSLPASRATAKRHSLWRAGFSVVEVFMVLGLLSALFTLAIINLDFPQRKWGIRPAKESLMRAVGEAHSYSRLTKEDALLRYDEETASIRVETTRGEPVIRISLAPQSVSSILFYRILPESERSESPTRELEEEPVNSIRFSPSGNSVPFAAELTTESGTTVLMFDPFSLALIDENKQ